MDAQQTERVRAAKAREEALPQKPRAPSRQPAMAMGRAYERFLELPVMLVLAVMWMAGVALLGAGVLVLYLAGWLLVRLVA